MRRANMKEENEKDKKKKKNVWGKEKEEGKEHMKCK